MADTPTFGHYTELSVEQMTPEQQAGYRLLVDGPRSRLPGPTVRGCTIPSLSRHYAPR